jgi:hypothetical protein
MKVKLRPLALPDESGAVETAAVKDVEVEVGKVDDVDDTTDALGEVRLDSRRTELRPPRTLETTLFDRLERIYGPGIKRLLAVQYRFVSPGYHGVPIADIFFAAE